MIKISAGSYLNGARKILHKDGINPDISRVRGVYLQGIQGCSRSRLLQTLDNAANRRLGHAHRVKIFEKLNNKTCGIYCRFTTIGKIVSNKLFS